MKAVALDLETTGMTWDSEVLVIGAAVGTNDSIETSSVVLAGGDLFTQTTPIPEAWSWLHQKIALADWIVLHNASFDLPYLFKLGLLTPEEVKGRVFDTLVMAAASAPHESMSLENLCDDYKIRMGKEWGAMKAARGRLAQRSRSEVAEYCAQDCVATLKLFLKVAEDAGKLYDRQFIADEGDFCSLLARMRVRGVQLDLDFVTSRMQTNKTRKEVISRDILAPNKISSPNSSGDILQWLTSKEFTPNRMTPGGKPCLDEEALQAAVNQLLVEKDKEVLMAVLEARGLEKEDSTYLTGFLEHADANGVIHPNFFSGGTRTWRLSSNHPNAQNITKDLQSGIFTASEEGGSLVMLDYSQAQLRLAAMYAQENNMARLFALPDTDIHTATAITLFGPEEGPKRRKEGKACNFSVLFGSGSSGVAQTFKLPIKLAEQVLIEHRRAFPRIQSGSREVINKWRERGYLILPYGKRIWRKASDTEAHVFAGWNYLIQGAEGNIVQMAMMELDRRGFRIVSQVHDSIYIDVPAGIDPDEVVAEAGRVMEEAIPPALSKRTNPPITMPTDAKIKRRVG